MSLSCTDRDVSSLIYMAVMFKVKADASGHPDVIAADDIRFGANHSTTDNNVNSMAASLFCANGLKMCCRGRQHTCQSTVDMRLSTSVQMDGDG